VLPRSTLAVRAAGAWRIWWRADLAPDSWTNPNAVLAAALSWHAASAGMQWGEIELAGSGEAWRTRVVLVKLDARTVHLRLDTAFTARLTPAWTLARADSQTVFAVNAGQFVQALPWGWVVLGGRQFLAPGRGPLSVAVVMDSGGTLRWLRGDEVLRQPTAHVAWAFESYPALLDSGVVPDPLRGSGRGLDVAHRDARLALGRLADGTLLVALTRFGAFGGTLGSVPFGLTTPEMAALMGALGCRDAVLLDGGISAQMLIRDSSGTAHRWHGLREVPLALTASPRPFATPFRLARGNGPLPATLPLGIGNREWGMVGRGNGEADSPFPMTSGWGGGGRIASPIP
ncbi:MAG: phosphodiester glycosidase family protein, partial [Gemmatimonadaceae bacterium]